MSAQHLIFTGSKSPRYVAPESYELKPCRKSDVFSAAVLLCACSRGPGASHVLSRATVDFVERVHVPAQVSLKFISVGGAVRQLSFSASARLETFYVRNAAGVTVE